MCNNLIYLKTAFESHLPLEKNKTKQNIGKKKHNATTSKLHSGLILWGLQHFDPYILYPTSTDSSFQAPGTHKFGALNFKLKIVWI